MKANSQPVKVHIKQKEISKMNKVNTQGTIVGRQKQAQIIKKEETVIILLTTEEMNEIEDRKKLRGNVLKTSMS